MNASATTLAILVGLLLGLIIAGGGYFNDFYMKQSLVASDLVPISVYGLLLIGLLAVNPLLNALKGLRFQARHWCIVVSLMLVSSVIPGPALMWHFTNAVGLPEHYNQQVHSWRADRLLSYVPDRLLVDSGQTPEQQKEIVGGLVSGMKRGDKLVGFFDIPWGAWTETMWFWMPLVAMVFIGGICLAIVYHRQWAHRERLLYPVAEFTAELVDGAGKGPWPRIFHNRMFWTGFVIAAVVLIVQGIHHWEPGFVTIPLQIDLTPLVQKWPALGHVPGYHLVLKPTFFFAVVGFAYFVSTDVSFSMGISMIAYSVVYLFLRPTDLQIGGNRSGTGLLNAWLFGAYLGLALMIFYIGRRFYMNVAKRALGYTAGAKVDSSAVWAFRGALLTAAAAVVLLVAMAKLHWLLAIFFVVLIGVMFTVLTRINAESGVFFVQPSWSVLGVAIALFGAGAMGPNMLIVMGLVALVVSQDPRVCMLPMAANALRFSEKQGVRPGRLGSWMILAVVLAMIFGVTATMYLQYNYGLGKGHAYDHANSVAQGPFKVLQQHLGEMNAKPGEFHPFELNPADWSINPQFLWTAAIAIGVVLLVSSCRLRFPWWPLHPVIFLVWGTWPMMMLSASFLMGCLLKTIISRLGGGKAYQKYKPLFIGLIAGEFMAGIFWNLFGLFHHLATGEVPASHFRVHP